MRSGDKLFWIWLSEALGAGSRDFKRLIELYKSPYEIFNTEESELERIPEIAEKTLKRLADKNLARASNILEQCEKLGIGMLLYTDELFPAQLRELARPPVMLYYKGTLLNFKERLTVGMVGTRRMSAYGLQNAYRIAYELARVGAVVVSGMAAGIDGVCAAAAIKGEGNTVAILGCGLDRVYPQHHRELMREIEQHGLLLSEYSPGTPPNHYHFPTRNRLISGLSRTTVVVEAGLGSGSLITAKDAISQGKLVFAVPANVGNRAAEGSNGLLRDGAKVAVCAKDILAPFQYSYAKTLCPERLLKADEVLRADLHYLDQLGVIELTQPENKEAEAASLCEIPPLRRGRPAHRTSKSVSQTLKNVEKTQPTDKNIQKQPKEQTPDEVFSSLSPVQQAILRTMPDDLAVSLDSLSGLEYSYGEIIAALTMLEILGLVQKLPGALYTKT
ncbi:MAG: DNA-processing protein DprA [Clostridia bacterium]|nr:DNA-processing protein DprA [Clostridia bacterium]